MLMTAGGASLVQEAKLGGGQEGQEATHCLRWGPEPTLLMMFSASAWQNPGQPSDKESGFAKNLEKASEISLGSLKIISQGCLLWAISQLGKQHSLCVLPWGPGPGQVWSKQAVWWHGLR